MWPFVIISGLAYWMWERSKKKKAPTLPFAPHSFAPPPNNAESETETVPSNTAEPSSPVAQSSSEPGTMAVQAAERSLSDRAGSVLHSVPSAPIASSASLTGTKLTTSAAQASLMTKPLTQRLPLAPTTPTAQSGSLTKKQL